MSTGESILTCPHLFPGFVVWYKGKKLLYGLPQSVEWKEIKCTGSSSAYFVKLRGCREDLVKVRQRAHEVSHQGDSSICHSTSICLQTDLIRRAWAAWIQRQSSWTPA